MSAASRRALVAIPMILVLLCAAAAPAATTLRKLVEMRLPILGVTATVDPVAPVVPKNIASAVRVVVMAGADELPPAEVARFMGESFDAQAELSGPGLRQTISLPQLAPGEDPPDDPLLLPLPPLPIAGGLRDRQHPHHGQRPAGVGR